MLLTTNNPAVKKYNTDWKQLSLPFTKYHRFLTKVGLRATMGIRHYTLTRGLSTVVLGLVHRVPHWTPNAHGTWGFRSLVDPPTLVYQSFTTKTNWLPFKCPPSIGCMDIFRGRLSQQHDTCYCSSVHYLTSVSKFLPSRTLLTHAATVVFTSLRHIQLKTFAELFCIS